ncbi:MAG: MazG nucleotide pyrophosphohydrolase domain-containing protein [Bacteroidia bacterium]
MYPEFPARSELPQLQQYVQDVCKAKGWDGASDLETFLLFTEEVGELAKAIRKHRALFYKKLPTAETDANLREEFADVLSYLLDLASRLDVDLLEAFREKMQSLN